jgi:hypothetical protein
MMNSITQTELQSKYQLTLSKGKYKITKISDKEIEIEKWKDDTSGCILVGESDGKGKLLNSEDTFKRVYKILKEASDKGEEITIQIQ